MRIGFTAAARRLDHRPLVLGRPVDLLRPGAVAEALHLHDPPLAVEALLAYDRADEDQREWDAEEGGAEVDRRAEEGAGDQQDENRDGDLHGGGIVRVRR